MATKIYSVSELPSKPAVYAMYGGRGQGLYVAYIGIADKLKSRISQHLLRRDSSVATGTSAVVLNPDYVTELKWWEHPNFSQRHILAAAELVAFDVLTPVLRSRGAIIEQAKRCYDDTSFQETMTALFQGEPSGQLMLLTLQDALDRIDDLERRLAEAESKLAKL